MKAYLAFLVALVLGACSLDIHLMHHYKPSEESLKRTTEIGGPLYRVGRRGGWTAEVNGIPLVCTMNFLGAQQQCLQRVSSLSSGTQMKVMIANVSATLSTVQLTMSIAVNGTQIYEVTPEEVLLEHIRSSRRALLAIPFFMLFLLSALWLVISSLRGFLMSPVD